MNFSIKLAILCILSFSDTFSQYRSGVVEYQVNMDVFLALQERKFQNHPQKEKKLRLTRRKVHYGNQLEKVLRFSENKAIFATKRKLYHPSSKYSERLVKMAELFIGSGVYYTSLKDQNYLHYHNLIGNESYVSRNRPKIQWKLHKVKKKIGRFVCYKATYIKKLPKRDFTVVAWYTPEIPLSFGPFEYYGQLPGLILELHLPTASFSTFSIKLKKTSEPLPWPKDVKIVSEEEYKKAGDAIFSRLKGN